MKSIYALLFVGLLSCNPKPDVSSMTESELIEYAKGIHDRVIVMDTHNDINISDFTPERNYSTDLGNQVNIPKMKQGGVDVACLVAYTGQRELIEEEYEKAYKKAIDQIKAIHKLAEEYAPDQVGLAYNSNDVRKILKSGKKVVMVAIENGFPIGMELSRVKEFSDLGAIYISITHNGHNQIADSNTGEEDSVWLHDGLSEFGIEVIKEMNKWGIMIDVSHPSRKAMLDMIKYSEAPIIASHSGARAVCDHSRNLDDEQLQLMKENGGVVQVVGLGYYLNMDKSTVRRDSINSIQREIAADIGFEMLAWSDVRKLSDEEMEVYRTNYYTMRDSAKPIIEKRLANVPDVNVSDFINHIDHIVETIGIDYVGIGTDFGGGGGIDGFKDHSEAFNVTLELVKRGYTEEDIKKIWGENLLRVLDKAQKVASQIQKKEKS